MPVLGAKLHLPKPRRQLVPRPRLTEQLGADPGSMPRLVLVAAPAGFGKTTVLTQWLTASETNAGGPSAAQGRRVAWLSVDQGDADAARFLTDVIAALQTTNPQVGVEASALMETQRGAATDILVSLINDLDTLAGPTVLVLDDYHRADAAGTHEAVSFLLDNLPAHVTVAITTRADPPLPLARLRARDELVELRAADLRFNDIEAERFLNDVMELGLSPDNVSALKMRTEGWAAGLQLAALSARGRAPGGALDGFVDAFSGSHRFVLDYLMEEVLRSQPAEVRAFLQDTSVLSDLSGPLCDAVTGRHDSQAMLEALERANLFLIPLDDRREWFRYHHLFADALQAKLAAADPARVTVLHEAAADWYAAHGRLAEAIGHALAAKDAEHAAALVELAIPGIRRHRQDRELRAWLRALPEDEIRRRPLLATFRGWLHLSEGDLDAADAWLDDARHALDRAPDAGGGPEAEVYGGPADGRARSAPGETLVGERQRELTVLPATIEIYRASIAQGRGDLAATIDHANCARELAGPEDHVARSGAAGFLALAAWAAGDLTRAVDTFGDCLRHLHQGGNSADELGGTVVMAGMWVALGRPDEARRRYERALETAESLGGSALSPLGDLHVGLADVLREHGRLDAAARHLETARELGERASLVENRFRWYAVTAHLHRARGDLTRAIELLQHAERRYLRGFFPDTQPLPAAIARVHIAQGRLDEAWRWATDHGVTADQEPAYLAEFDLLTLARLLIAQYRVDQDAAGPEAATALLDRVLTAAQVAERGGSIIEARLVRSLARDAHGARDAALDDLDAALAAGVPVGYARLFLDEGPPFEELLRAASARNGLAAAHAEALLGATLSDPSHLDPGTRHRRAEPAGGEEGLSERELEVLRLLATDLTGPEIADHLYVSVNTLRSHTKHIFTKLGVNTRRSAVRRADELHLL